MQYFKKIILKLLIENILWNFKHLLKKGEKKKEKNVSYSQYTSQAFLQTASLLV